MTVSEAQEKSVAQLEKAGIKKISGLKLAHKKSEIKICLLTMVLDFYGWSNL
jgi:hypothetical protein